MDGPQNSDEVATGRAYAQAFLVIQGAADIGTDWRDIEKLRDCLYARRVYPKRLEEYGRGDCSEVSMRYSQFRIVLREVRDTPYVAGRDEQPDVFVSAAKELSAVAHARQPFMTLERSAAGLGFIQLKFKTFDAAAAVHSAMARFFSLGKSGDRR